MDLTFYNLLDMEPRTPTRLSTPTSTMICSRLQQLAKEVDRYSTFVKGKQFIIDALKPSGIYDPDNPYVKELYSLYEFTDLHHQGHAPQFEKRLPNENTLNAPTPNQNTLNAPNPNYVPPPIMLKVIDAYKQQMKIITDKFPSTRGKLTGEYLKLYTNTNELHRQLIHLLEDLKYEFYVITPKEKRPIKVVIKGPPRDTKTDEIKNDLIEVGFTVDKVSHVIGRITNQPLPVFLISLPRNNHNSKIFDLNKLCFLTVSTTKAMKAKGLAIGLHVLPGQERNRDWSVEDWKRVAWRDEYRFRPLNVDGRLRIWHQAHEPMDG
ncbi:PRE_C2HC domain-containing protein [Trichonephila clavipes]|nr:PRE_C2HC domain-containing protein [Trichonephila clavipes]